jgi:hypothetical protein
MLGNLNLSYFRVVRNAPANPAEGFRLVRAVSGSTIMQKVTKKKRPLVMRLKPLFIHIASP